MQFRKIRKTATIDRCARAVAAISRAGWPTNSTGTGV